MPGTLRPIGVPTITQPAQEPAADGFSHLPANTSTREEPTDGAACEERAALEGVSGWGNHRPNLCLA